MTALPVCHGCGASFEDCWGDDPTVKCCASCDHAPQTMPKAAQLMGYSGLFVLSMPVDDVALWRGRVGFMVTNPELGRRAWYVRDVEELVIGARVNLVRRDMDAIMDFAGPLSFSVGQFGG